MTAADRIAQIRARVEAATPGEPGWHQGRANAPYESDVEIYSHREPVAGVSEDIARAWRKEDADFIAHARADIPTLLAAVEAALDLHCPGEFLPGPGEGMVSTPDDEPVLGCLACETPYYPCPTVRAIEEALA